MNEATTLSPFHNATQTAGYATAMSNEATPVSVLAGTIQCHASILSSLHDATERLERISDRVFGPRAPTPEPGGAAGQEPQKIDSQLTQLAGIQSAVIVQLGRLSRAIESVERI